MCRRNAGLTLPPPLQREAHLQQREEAFALQQTISGRRRPTAESASMSKTVSGRYALSTENPVQAWGENEVATWISVLPDGLAQYQGVFRQNHIDGGVRDIHMGIISQNSASRAMQSQLFTPSTTVTTATLTTSVSAISIST